MHSLRIVHGDIKKENVMFSPSRNKLVFIDFNCSSAVKEKPGSKTLTKFVGTPGWCSPEMMKLSKTNICEFIDVYYNDIYGLLKLK